MSVKLLTQHHLEYLSFKGGCTCSSVSTLVKIPHCWKSRVTAHMFLKRLSFDYKLVRDNSLLAVSSVNYFTMIITLVNLYVDLVVFTRIAGTS